MATRSTTRVSKSKRFASAKPARPRVIFEVGERCRVGRDFRPAIIVGGYSAHVVRCERPEDAVIDCEGAEPRAIRWGYVVLEDGANNRVFFPAGSIVDAECEIRHLARVR